MSNQLKEQAVTINIKMAAYLKNQRNNSKLTMRQLAINLGTPHSFIGKTEQHNRRMDVGEFIIYCQHLNRNPIEVLQEVIDLAGTQTKDQ